MKQLFLNRGKVFLKDLPIPVLQDNQVLVKVFYSFISSGTELATIKNSQESIFTKVINNLSESAEKVVGAVKENGLDGTVALIKGKLNSYYPMGYSCSGIIVAIGSRVEGFNLGDYVACAGSGIANHAEYVTVPVNLIVKLKNIDNLKQASLTTLGAIALQGIRRANLQLGENVCVLGLGLIGQITAQLAKLAGCKVFGVDIQKERLDLASKYLDYSFNPNFIDLNKEINFLTKHYGVDVTIITASSNSGKLIENSMQITRRKGRVILVGDVKLDFSREFFYSKEIDFLISCSYGPGRYDNSYEQAGIDYPYSYVRWTENRNLSYFAQLIEEKKIDLSSLISFQVDVNQADKAYNYLNNKQALGVVLSYENNINEQNKESLIKKIQEDLFKQENSKNNNIIPFSPIKNKISIGFIGTGGFAKIKLLPLISKINNTDIYAFSDTDNTNLYNIAQLYKAKKIVSDYRKIIVDDDINSVVIATPHRFHFQQAIDCLNSGKAVFVEKPAAINLEQYNELKNYFEINKKCFYSVDFNRSFAPFILNIKEVIQNRVNPLLITYRMNVGFIPKDHWIQGFANGGRIIGEACHIFELFTFLTDAMPVNISVESLGVDNKDILSSDNIITQISMDDGSCCSLIYSSLGNGLMSKERMEIFFDGKSIVMDDYKELVGYGLPISFNKKVGYADKGHERLLRLFFEQAQQDNFKLPIPIERILMATKVSLIVDKLARSGGGSERFEF